MILRNGEYVFIDGTIASMEGLQSMYMSRTRHGIVFQYMDGHRIEIKYDSKISCSRAWNDLVDSIPDIADGRHMLMIHDSMIVRVDSIRHIEFDEIDYRFAILYKTGECFVFDFESKVITLRLFRILVEQYFGVKDYATSSVRKRADFWQNVTAVINSRMADEETPNVDYWNRLDQALVNANGKFLKEE